MKKNGGVAGQAQPTPPMISPNASLLKCQLDRLNVRLIGQNVAKSDYIRRITRLLAKDAECVPAYPV